MLYIYINCVERNFSVFFSGIDVAFFSGTDVAGCRIVDIKDEVKPAYEYSIGH